MPKYMRRVPSLEREVDKLVIDEGSGLPLVKSSRKLKSSAVHKTANVINKMPISVQAKAKKRIHNIYLAETMVLEL